MASNSEHFLVCMVGYLLTDGQKDRRQRHTWEFYIIRLGPNIGFQISVNSLQKNGATRKRKTEKIRIFVHKYSILAKIQSAITFTIVSFHLSLFIISLSWQIRLSALYQMTHYMESLLKYQNSIHFHEKSRYSNRNEDQAKKSVYIEFRKLLFVYIFFLLITNIF